MPPLQVNLGAPTHYEIRGNTRLLFENVDLDLNFRHEMESDHACLACGLTTWRAERLEYESHVKLHHIEEDRGVWAIGTDYIIKEQPISNYDNANNEVPCLRFIKDNSTIPVPTIIKDWTDKDKRYFRMQGRIVGDTLEDAWSTLSTPQKSQIADEAAHYLLQLRQFQSPKTGSFLGRPCPSNYLFPESTERLHGPFDYDDAFYEDLIHELDLPEQDRLDLRKRLPDCAPYTLTHGNLTICNFLINAGHLVGIVDWETVSYAPVWWEYVRANVTHGPEDAEWKGMLRERMNSFPQGDELFWKPNAPSNLDKLGWKGKSLARALGWK